MRVEAPASPGLIASAWDPTAGTTRQVSTLADTAGKLGVALLVFLAIITVWALYQMRHQPLSPLPNAPVAEADCTLWFVGSSSVHKWTTLAPDMKPWRTRNRGVDGAIMNDLLKRFAYERAAPRPEAIVYYAGENDIARGASVRRALVGLARFVETKHRKYGDTPILVLSLKPSPTRWNDRPKQTAFNRAVRRLAASRSDVLFVDIAPLLLQGGRPGPYYQQDGIHMNAAGYAIWAGAIRKALATKLPRDVIRRCSNSVA